MVKEIKCFGGQIVLVDDEDYPILSRHAWCLCGKKERKYASTTMNYTNGGIKVYMHHMIMGTINVDHKSGDQFNNQKDNLREANKQQNGWNRRKQKDSAKRKCTSKYKGVSKVIGKYGEVYWSVIIKTTAKGVKPAKYVKKDRFKTERAAALWYDQEIVKLRGEWAVTNILKNNNN
jgi:hypothetical protein